MRISRSKLAVGAAIAGLIAFGLPATGQDKPESLLPEGFDQPPPSAPAPPPVAAPVQPTAPLANATDREATPSPTPSATATPAIDPALLARYELPDYARRSLAQIGLSGDGALPSDATGNADGRFLETLMRRVDTPLASRWLSIALRRTLMSPLDTPAGLNGADYAAERAWLLLRMGEATAARAVVQGVDPDRATPKLIQVAMQAALATGDVGAMCPVTAAAAKVSRDAGWALARAMCLALEGSPAEAGAAVDAAKRRGLGEPIDVLLAEKVVGAGSQGRRAVTIEWGGIDRLTAWRYGLAVASGVTIPEELVAGSRPQVRYWRAQAPMIDAAARIADAEAATAQGVLSNLALVGMYGDVEASGDEGTAEGAIARDLRTAYVGATAADRVGALTTLWGETPERAPSYARLVLTARAAARIRPNDAMEQADRMVASILSAGLDRNVLRWAGRTPEGGDAWAMIALANPAGRALTAGAVRGYDGSELKRRMLFAGLAGLGRLAQDDIAALAEGLDVDIGRSDPWTRAIDAAARARQPGTVVLLCAAGMQTSDWRGVPPASLYRMVAALRATGLEGYARMIAAEAIARL